MSQYCPLCGKNKSANSIFCSDCKKKIESEYEVDVPARETENLNQISEINNRKESLQSKSIELPIDHSKEAAVSSNEYLSPTNKSAKNKLSKLFWLIILVVVLASGFLFYGYTARRNFLDKSHWETAQKTHTIGGYINYMLEFPKGKFYNMAEENIMQLKKSEIGTWEQLHSSENSAELRDFITAHPQSSYIPLIKKRLDSLEWASALKDNSSESYSKYIEMVQRNDFSGIYIHDAEKRFQLLNQTYPVNQNEWDSLKFVIDGFFTALSSLNVDHLEKYLAPRVFRFFGPGGGTREKIIGDLLISGSKTQSPTINFTPDLSGLTYEKTEIEHFKVNLPIQKTIVESDGKEKIVTGFIIQMEIDQNFQIVTITEDEPRYR